MKILAFVLLFAFSGCYQQISSKSDEHSETMSTPDNSRDITEKDIAGKWEVVTSSADAPLPTKQVKPGGSILSGTYEFKNDNICLLQLKLVMPEETAQSDGGPCKYRVGKNTLYLTTLSKTKVEVTEKYKIHFQDKYLVLSPTFTYRKNFTYLKRMPS